MKAGKETPLMGQYNKVKAKYPDAILLFRVGDFYETFSQDAVTTSKVLGIVLTRRANGSASHVELAGFPYHALDAYLPKLVKAGYRVAICEQLEDPKLTKTIVKRGVTELITPGVATSEKMLDTKSNNYLASFHIENVKDKRLIGMSFLDISTGEFFVAQGNPDYCEKLLHSLQPAEIILSKSNQKIFKELFGNKFYLYTLDDWIFTTDFAKEKLLHHFNTSTLKGFGIEELHLAIIGAGSTLHYLGETEHNNLGHITSISRLAEEQYVWLDRFTIRNLELLHSPMEDGIPLYSVLDKTITPMGTRLLKRWIIMPLKDKQSIEARHDTVESFIKDAELSKQVSNSLKIVGDLERLISKVSLQKITPREVIQLNRAIHALEPLRKTLLQNENIHLRKSGDRINTCDIIRKQIDDEIIEDAPNQINKGNIIRKGVNAELDELRAIGSSGKDYLVQLQQKEIERTGITNLKIGFNNVFGYYLEVTNRFKDAAPEDWIRKQTLTNAERYITPELKVYEEKILGAEEKIIALEQTIFETLVHTLNEYVKPIQLNAQIIAQLDCLLSFATIAMQSSYRRPELNTGNALRIKEGRHPVIEKHLPIGEKYVPNDIYLNNDDQQIMIITGPNMAGKSALLRQTALIVMMAQMGSFVPATEAQIGIVDKIFTRVGASDNISSGESTFMVEMTETASIMNNISANSLILLDEIGRGTSTFDGISIAWSLCEYLHNNITAHPKTLFATHYHELSELENRYERIHNFHVATKEAGNKVIFLRTLQPGSIKHSFGIHVARMAGMPKEIVDGANEVLKELEQKNLGSELQNKLRKVQKQTYQLSIFGMDNPELLKVKEILDNLDINALSPIEALMKLKELKEIMQV
ncbi:MAG: DNA mismatch repair protein MutS [Bacteroidetes bacterium]|nr:DNA mismatch repair protein MutS [Bacteroidota bacterium]MBK7109508.1 DNA mismatch repair protein MutS [Bacteroidota bacterium]MBK8682490.1 DNA mismatch repair protein MutS [Bacteroidota bacterium]MBP9548549.1 DNA mismatch repair protein MutS [Chitinophagales bacterium]MBP9703113.1 DNA mismatch repair protein MutS [Chitinophagales bacterium]